MFALMNVGSWIRAVVVTGCAVLSTGCLMSGDETGSDAHPARVTVVFNLGAEETSSIGRRMVVLMTSGRDTLCDTLTRSGSLRSTQEGAFLPDPASVTQTVSARYDLAPGRNWKILARVIDDKDSLRSIDSGWVDRLQPFEYRAVEMNLNSRFTSYSARFALPASIALAGETSARKIRFTRLSLDVDGRAAYDSIVSAGSNLSSSVSLTTDYIESGSRNITLSAYGTLEGDTAGVTQPRLLFQGVHRLQAVLGKAASDEKVPLDWKAASAGQPESGSDQAKLVVRLGKVGSLTVRVVLSGALDF
jgi:hypothetical protein